MSGWLMVTRRSAGTVEAEPVIVDSDGDRLLLTLDDGDSLEMSFAELVVAVEDEAARREVA